jgi:hypothetical protein
VRNYFTITATNDSVEKLQRRRSTAILAVGLAGILPAEKK